MDTFNSMKCHTRQFYPALLDPKREEPEDIEEEEIGHKKHPDKWCMN